jgi:YD repeat-containing protein
MLTGIQIGTGRTNSFSYNKYGELAELQVPDGGCLRWEYDTNHFYQGFKIREVVRRMIATSRQTEESAYIIDRDNNAPNILIHSKAILRQSDQSAGQIWSFCTDRQSPFLGLATSFEEYDAKGQNILRKSNYTWELTGSGVPYKCRIETILDPNTADEARTKMEFVRDIFGNLSEQRQFEFNEATKPYRIIRQTYLTDTAYLSRNIFNRLGSASVSNGIETIELMRCQYDTTPLADRSSILEHDENCGSTHISRGNLTEVRHNNRVFSRNYYDISGSLIAIEDRSGKRTNIEPKITSDSAF